MYKMYAIIVRDVLSIIDVVLT